MKDLKYVVVGAGAMGAYVTRFAARAGKELWFVDPYEAHMKAIAENGLYIYETYDVANDVEPEITKNIHAVTTPDEVGKADVIIVMVKTPYTRSCIPNIQKMATEDTIIISLQNGVGHIDILEEYFPKENIAYGCIMASSRLEKPGVIRGGGHCGVHFGSDYKDKWPILEQVAKDMNAGGAQYSVDEDFKKEVWKKIAINCSGNALTAITHLDLNAYFSNQRALDAWNNTMREVMLVANAKGVGLQESDLLFKTELKPWTGVRGHRTTLYQDVIAKKKTEIEFLNGAIAHMGEQLGIPTPYNTVLTNLVQIIEETYEIRDI